MQVSWLLSGPLTQDGSDGHAVLLVELRASLGRHVSLLAASGAVPMAVGCLLPSFRFFTLDVRQEAVRVARGRAPRNALRNRPGDHERAVFEERRRRGCQCRSAVAAPKGVLRWDQWRSDDDGVERVTTAALIARLDALTDAEREDFLRLAAQLAPGQHPTDYYDRTVNRALYTWRNDDTAGWSWEFSFDPSFPDTGLDALASAGALVEAMEDALDSGDEAASRRLDPAFRQLGLGDEARSSHGR